MQKSLLKFYSTVWSVFHRFNTFSERNKRVNGSTLHVSVSGTVLRVCFNIRRLFVREMQREHVISGYSFSSLSR